MKTYDYDQAIDRLTSAIEEAIESAPRWQNCEAGIVAYVNRDGEVDFDVCPKVSTSEVAYHLNGWTLGVTIRSDEWEECPDIYEAASEMAEEVWGEEIARGMLDEDADWLADEDDDEDEEDDEEEDGYEWDEGWLEAFYGTAMKNAVPAWDDEA